LKLIDNLKVFFDDARTEFKKISWPSRDEVKDSTIIVCTTIVFVMVVLGLYDTGIVTVANFAQKLFSK
jgi:preprotein translocase SecE subunit